MTANSAASFANGAFVTANNAYTNSNNAYNTANSSGVFANGAFTTANNAYTNSNNAYNTANSSGSFANGAFTTANNALPKSGGTMTGTLYVNTGASLSVNTTGSVVIGGDVTISGNLNISGTANTYTSNTLTVNDPMIYLAANNSGDAVDIGFVGHIVGQGSSSYSHYQHLGFVRDFNDRKWKLFSNVSAEPTTTVNFDANTIYDTLKVGTIEATTANILSLIHI